MMEYIIRINRKEVYDEVAKTTAYTGAKLGVGEAYDRIFTTDEDQEMLERFWQEGKNALVSAVKRVLTEEQEVGGVYEIHLGLSSAFDSHLLKSIERSVYSYFVMGICGKWYGIANKEEASTYAEESRVHLEDALRKVFYKKKPTRPTY